MAQWSRNRITLWGVLSMALVGGLCFAFWPRALAVDLEVVAPGPMTLTVGDEGETRVVDIFEVSAPIGGRLRRIEAEPGDVVKAAETVVGQIEPTDPELLDPRSAAEAKAQFSAAESAEALAAAEVERAQAELGFARSEHERIRNLVRDGAASARDLDAAETTLKARRAALGVAQAALEVRRFEHERVRALLMSPAESRATRQGCECLDITSPVDGLILRVLRESEGVVAAGTALVEVGDPTRLEVVVDLLSIDAVKVKPGQKAWIRNWGGEGDLEARVRRVDPFGFTKISALGIEEQRVDVVLDIVSPKERWSRLGHGYQVDVEVVLWEAEDVLTVPITALFRNGGTGWALFVREGGRAVRRDVEVREQTARRAHVVSGLAAGEAVVVYPGEGIEPGVRIVGR